jgi:hypothetical protein
MPRPERWKRQGKAIAESQGGESARACWGRPDVIVFVEALNHRALCQIVLQKGQRALGVKATDTRLLVEM